MTEAQAIPAQLVFSGDSKQLSPSLGTLPFTQSHGGRRSCPACLRPPASPWACHHSSGLWSCSLSNDLAAGPTFRPHRCTAQAGLPGWRAGYKWSMTSWLLWLGEAASLCISVPRLLFTMPGAPRWAVSPGPGALLLLLIILTSLALLPAAPTWNLGVLARSALDFIQMMKCLPRLPPPRFKTGPVDLHRALTMATPLQAR